MAYVGPEFRVKLANGETYFGKIRLSVTTTDVPHLPKVDKVAQMLAKEGEFIMIDLQNGEMVVVAKAYIVSVTPSEPDQSIVFSLPNM